MEGMKARGDIAEDLMTDLFKEYHMALDKKSVWYIKIKKYCYADR